MFQKTCLVTILVSLVCGVSGVAASEETVEADAELSSESPAEDGDSEEDGIGLNLDLGFATAYIFRGYNVFQQSSQLDQNMLLAPGITWSISDTGLWIGYWGAFQVSGDNVGDNIDAGVGAEQDLLAGYDLEVGEAVTFSVGLAYYFYPFVDEDAAGCKTPSYLEPSLGISLATVVDIGLTVSYFAGVQDAVSDYRYLYLNPTLGKSFELHEMVGLDLALGYGYKFYHPDSSVDENFHDVLFTIGLPIYLPRGFYVTPSFGMAWTDIRDRRQQPGTSTYVPTAGTAGTSSTGEGVDEFVFYGGLNVGVNL